MEERSLSAKLKYGWKVFLNCLFNALIPFCMYLVMGMLLAFTQAISNEAFKYILGVFCLLAAMAYNVYSCYHDGKKGYKLLSVGNLRRKSEAEGHEVSKKPRKELEYRPWKGFVFGFFVALPVLIVILCVGNVDIETMGMEQGTLFVFLTYFGGWAIIPVSWIGAAMGGVSTYWMLLMGLIPILTSGISYLVGARRERASIEALEEKAARDRALAEEHTRQQKERVLEYQRQRDAKKGKSKKK